MDTQMTGHRLVLTVEEAARLLRISRGLAYEMVKQHALPTIRLGRRILVPRSALDRLLSDAATKPNEKTTEGEIG